MTRRLLNLLTALSLLLCVAVVALWARGVGTGDRVMLKAERKDGGTWTIRYWEAASVSGRVRVGAGLLVYTDERDAFMPGGPDGRPHLQSSTFTPGAETAWPVPTVERVLVVPGPGYRDAGWRLVVPDWLLVAAALFSRRCDSSAGGSAATIAARRLRGLRLRPPRHARAVPGVRT